MKIFCRSALINFVVAQSGDFDDPLGFSAWPPVETSAAPTEAPVVETTTQGWI